MASKAEEPGALLDAQSTTVQPLLSDGSLACVPWREMTPEVEAWDALTRDAAEPNPFYESWYLLPSLKALDAKGTVSILRFKQDGRLRGLMPLVLQPRYYRWPLPNMTNWVHPNCFFGTPLVAGGAEVPFWRALLKWADTNPGRALFLHLSEVALGGPLQAALEAVLATEDRPWGIVKQDDRALLASDLGAQAYLAASLSRQKHKDLRRRLNRLSELGEVRFEWEHGTANLANWIEEFLTLEASGWKGDSGSAMVSDPATDALFRESLTGAASRGRLVRLSLRLNRKPIAMLSTFVTPPGSFGYKTAFDESLSRFSPGVLLEREFLAFMDRPEVRWCDSCAAADHSVMNQIWRERRAIGRLSIGIGGTLRRSAFRQLIRKETASKPGGTQA